MKQDRQPRKSPFAGKAAIKREPTKTRFQSAEREQARRFSGNGLSRTAMLFKIATMAGRRLSPVELNKVRDVNPRQLERVYEHLTAHAAGSTPPHPGRRAVRPAAGAEIGI